MKNIIYSFLLAFALFLTGCADAGEDQTVNSSATVTLDANDSTPDHGREITKYEWKQVKHYKDTPKVTLSDKNAVMPTFVAPSVDKETELTFRLKTTESCKKKTKRKCRKYTSHDFVHICVKASDDGDTVAPILTLIGNKNIVLAIGDTYTEKGANATDNIDGNISGNIIIKGTVDTSTVGTYTLTYSVSDEAGNKAIPLTRTVTVKNTVQNVAPRAFVTADKPMDTNAIGPNFMNIKVNDTVHFSSKESNDTDGQIVSYSWKNPIDEIINVDTNYTFSFTSVGTFDIKLIVTDNDGANGEKTVRVTVKN